MQMLCIPWGYTENASLGFPVGESTAFLQDRTANQRLSARLDGTQRGIG